MITGALDYVEVDVANGEPVARVHAEK